MASSIRGNEKPSWRRAFWGYYTLVLHALIAIAILPFMLYVIDTRIVNYNGQRLGSGIDMLQANDITTIISAAVVVIRIVTGSWTARSAWRCAFILLETQGITLQEFNRMVSWPAYFLSGSPNAWLATLILLLLVPANLVAPVITGAVGWQDVSYPEATRDFHHFTAADKTSGWYWYTIRSGTALQSVLLSAVGGAAVGWSASDKFNSSTSRYVIKSEQEMMPVNSTIENIILPYLEINSISWDNKSDFNKDITDQLNYNGSSIPDSKLTLTQEPPFNYYHPGNAALFDENFQNNYPVSNYSNWTAQIPSPTVFRGTKKIALLVVRQSTNNCTSLNETIFGNQTSMTKLTDLYSYHNDYDENCFLIGTVNFTAGVIRSSKATYITPRVIEVEKDSSSSIDSDNWVIESLYALPDVMPKVSLLNVSQLATWDNIDGYVENLIRLSYQATWGEYSGFNTVPLNLKAHQFRNRLQAAVSRPRVYGWYCAQLLVLVSGVLLWMLQRESRRPVAIDGGVAALLVDSTPVLDRYDATEKLSCISYVTTEDGGGKKVQLVESTESTSSGEKLPTQVRRFQLTPLDT